MQLSDYESALRSGYIDSDFKYYNEEGSGRTHVIRSIVRFRNKQVAIGLFGARSTETDPDNGVYDIDYGGTCIGKELGKYTATATLTPVSENYKFKITGTLAADRHMTVNINGDGTVSISKEWYIASIDNGLMSQHAPTYGNEWNFTGWTYGAYKTQYAPRLEHGDPGEYQGVIEFSKDNNLVTFELFRSDTSGLVSREKIGQTFNRYEFADYINASVPAGSYVLKVYVGSYTSKEHVHWYDGTPHDGQAAGIHYGAFDREFNFPVEKANFAQTNVDTLENKRFTYTYDGNLHLLDGAFELNAPVSAERTGIWADAAYAGYFGKAELRYNLVRWNTGAFLTEAGLASYNNERQKPQGADTYTVRYKLVAPNYNDFGGDKSFTVIINKAKYDMSGVTYGNLEATYDGTVKNITVSGLPAGVTYKADGVRNAGNHKLVVTFTGDSINYEAIPAGNVTLVIHKAAVVIPESRTVTLEGDSYVYTADSNLYEVVGNSTFTQAGDYEITLRLKDANNYTWRTADGGVLDSETVETVLS